ncbi:MAG: CHAP domain-containing protein [Bacilli bacterium]|nr:CHAP domain-containing protein [Bacilli bacterium]
MFKPQTSLPEKGNPFYNTTGNGGYSWCIQGKPVVDGLNVLCNCVGYCCARFNEVYSELTGYKGMKYPQLNCNAENFIERAKSIGLTYQLEPIVGGIMVWEGVGSLAGHVAFVEDKPDTDNVFTSESGYNHFDFRNYTRSRGNGNWGLNSNFIYLGCIINPAIPVPPEPVPPTPPETFPFTGLVAKGSKFYSESGRKYSGNAKSSFQLEVLGEQSGTGRYKVYSTRLNPNIVYTDKGNVTKVNDYPFKGIIKGGSPLYNQNGVKYKYGTRCDREVDVIGELNGRYKIYCTKFTPNTVYCNKSDVTRK